jgi:hypothetical protein
MHDLQLAHSPFSLAHSSTVDCCIFATSFSHLMHMIISCKVREMMVHNYLFFCKRLMRRVVMQVQGMVELSHT